MTKTKVYNFALTGVSGAGKTSLIENLLFFAKATKIIGQVDNGTSNLDFEPEEIARKISIKSSVSHLTWKDSKVFPVDTPGDDNFSYDRNVATSCVDNIFFTVDASEPIKPQTLAFWRQISSLNASKSILINKSDKLSSDIKSVLQQLKEKLDIKPVPFNLPSIKNNEFKGVFDLFSMKFFGDEGFDHLKDDINFFRSNLIEFTAESDDQLLEKYLEGCEFTYEQLLYGIKKGIKDGGFVPVFFISPSKDKVFEPFLNFVTNFLISADEITLNAIDPNTKKTKNVEPTPIAPLSASVFKTVVDPFAGRINIMRIYSGTLKNDMSIFNSTKNQTEKCVNLFYMLGKNQTLISSAQPGEIVAIPKLKSTETGDTICDSGNHILYTDSIVKKPLLSYSVKPKTRNDEEKISVAMAKLIDEDPSLVFSRDSQTNEMILSGNGQIHFDVSLEKLSRKFGVNIELFLPKIPYRETIKGESKGVVYRHKKQSGGAGQFAEVHFDISPLTRGKGFEFEEALVGMNVPRNFVPAVEKGINEALLSGPLGGFPVVDIKVKFYDGKSHEVDSSEIAFKIAAIQCFKKGILEAKPILLEPFLKFSIIVPDDSLGDVIGDLNSRRGRVMGMNSLQYNYHEITAIVPHSEVRRYLLDLNALSGGRGVFSQEFSHFEEVPNSFVDKIIAEEGKKEE